MLSHLLERKQSKTKSNRKEKIYHYNNAVIESKDLARALVESVYYQSREEDQKIKARTLLNEYILPIINVKLGLKASPGATR